MLIEPIKAQPKPIWAPSKWPTTGLRVGIAWAPQIEQSFDFLCLFCWDNSYIINFRLLTTYGAYTKRFLRF